MTEEPKVNYEKLAEACGMGNPRSASNAWRSIKAKIMAKGTVPRIFDRQDLICANGSTSEILPQCGREANGI